MNKIIQGNAIEQLKTLPEKSINMCMTSPPYWALRDYGEGNESIWNGDKSCEHDFEIVERQLHSGTLDVNKTIHHALKVGALKTDWKTKDGFCNKCGAWKGQLGLEPTFDLYIKNLCDIFDEVKRVLRDDGTCWVNIGDSYAGQMGKKQGWTDNKSVKDSVNKGVTLTKKTKIIHELPQKCLVGIPFRFAIEMVNRGWILRNTIIWHKRNCMPSSVKDRFTVDFEYLFFFSKKKKYYFETQYEPIQSETIERNKYGWDGNKKVGSYSAKRNSGSFASKVPYAVQPRDKEFVEYRNLPNIKEFANYINSKRKELEVTIDEVEEQFGNQKAHHWFNAESFPSVEDYKTLKQKIELDSFYDKQMTEVFKKSSEKKNAIELGRNKRTVWTINPKPFKGAHFAVYPEELCETPIKSGCCEGGIVLDCFFGSGTTGLVALKQNKKFIGIELNKEYIEIANKRLKPFLEQRKL